MVAGKTDAFSGEARHSREGTVTPFTKPSRRSKSLSDADGDEWTMIGFGGMSSSRAATTPSEAAKAQTISDVASALQTLKQLPASELPSIVQDLLPKFLKTLEDLLRRGGEGGDKKDTGPGVGILMKAAAPAVGVFFTKAVMDKALNALQTSNCSVEWVQAYLNAAFVIGCFFLGSGTLLQVKKPDFSNIIFRLGAVVIMFALSVPVGLALPPVAGLAFALVVVVTVGLTAALF